MEVVYNRMFSYEKSSENNAFDLIVNSPCEILDGININPFPMEEEKIEKEFCKNLADGLTKELFLESALWVKNQESLIKNEIDNAVGEGVFDVLKTKMFIDYELYIKFILNEYLKIFNDKFEEDLRDFSGKVNDTIQLLSIYGVIFSGIFVMVAYWNYHRKSSKLFIKSMYIVKLIPFQTLSENTYVKSRLLKILGLNSY